MEDKKNSYYKITVSDMAPHVHKFLPYENKVEKIYNWLSNWIKFSLECGKIQPNDFLPSKADLACHIGVSQGTMQNVFRLLENAGLVESKQRIGTYIKNPNNKNVEKLTSKNDLSAEIIKKILLDNNYQIGDIIPSTRNLAQITGFSNTTLRLAIVQLTKDEILVKENNCFKVNKLNFIVKNIELKTLVEKIADELNLYISSNLTTGDKLPSNIELAKKFNTSVKTIHEAIKFLVKEGVLYTKRGKYGTIVINQDKDVIDSYLYNKYELKIRQYLIDSCKVGDKLPSIKELAQKYKTSEKTIKRGLDNLVEDGYLTFSRGRYGGTFVLDIPQSTSEAYKWIAINTDFMAN